MTAEERNAIQNLCYEYSHIFHLEGDKMTCTNEIYHEIKTPGIAQPINLKPYRLPHAQKGEINKQVREMEQNGIIVQSDNQWNAPLLVAPKKEDITGT